MKTRAWFIYLFTIATDFLGVLLVLFARIFGASGYRAERPPKGVGLYVMTCDVPWLPGRYSAITIAPHVIVYRKGRRLPNGWSKLQAHEHIHCEQFEAAGLFVSFVALWALLGAIKPWLALAVWVCGPWLYMAVGYAVAWLRGEDPYRGSHNEEAAYALAAEDDD